LQGAAGSRNAQPIAQTVVALQHGEARAG